MVKLGDFIKASMLWLMDPFAKALIIVVADDLSPQMILVAPSEDEAMNRCWPKIWILSAFARTPRLRYALRRHR